jgi:NAD(P)-dependent dehydrogenase (short-subunit alcohol dehydrogenase family)
MKLGNKVAIVTGGSQGIGEAIALRYAADGAKVAIVYHSNDATAAAVVDQIKQAGGTAKAFKADIAKPAESDRLVKEVIAAFGRVDILVNNAGLFRTVPVEETTEAIWDDTMNLNLKGAFFCTKALVPEFKKNGGGKVINVTSTAGHVALPAQCAAYCASKGGLELLTKALAGELGKFNVNVNSLAPGNTATPLNAHLRGPGNERYMELMRTMTCTGRDFLAAEELAGPAVFLASDDCSGMHGTTLMVDAGWTAW